MGVMTALLSTSLLRVEAQTEEPARPVWLGAAIAAGWAAAVGLLCCLAVAVVAWFAGSSGEVSDAIRAGAFAWLLGHGSGLGLAAVTVTAVPLGLSIAWAALLYRAAAWAGATCAVTDARSCLVGAGLLTGVYAGITGLVSVLAATPTVAPGTLRTLLGSALLAFVSGGLGLARGSKQAGPLWRSTPESLRVAAIGAAAGTAVMLGVGALLVSVSLASHFTAAGSVADALRPGAVGGAVLVLLGVAVLPNAALFAGAFAAGPGFALGTGTVVAPSGVHLGAVPAFPLLAALPSDGSQPWWVGALVTVPMVAGAVVGTLVVRRYPVYGLDVAALRGGIAGVCAGVAFGLLTGLAGGVVGPGRMTEVGPDVWGTTAVCAVAMGLGGVVAGTLCRLVSRRSDRAVTR
jgi:Family of unknown function (DUF6350)